MSHMGKDDWHIVVTVINLDYCPLLFQTQLFFFSFFFQIKQIYILKKMRRIYLHTVNVYTFPHMYRCHNKIMIVHRNSKSAIYNIVSQFTHITHIYSSLNSFFPNLFFNVIIYVKFIPGASKCLCMYCTVEIPDAFKML